MGRRLPHSSHIGPRSPTGLRISDSMVWNGWNSSGVPSSLGAALLSQRDGAEPAASDGGVSCLLQLIGVASSVTLCTQLHRCT